MASAIHCGLKGLEPTGACANCYVSTKKSSGYKCWGYIEIKNLDYIEYLANKKKLV